MAVRPPDLVYAVDDRPPAGRLAGLGLQYAILVSVYLITLVLAARAARAPDDIARNVMSLGLIACAAGVSFQAWRGRFFGSGFLAPPVFSVIYIGPSILAAKAGGLPAVAGMTIFAGLVEIGLAMLLPRLKVIFQPTVTGFIIFVLGVQLGVLALSEVLDVPEASQPGFGWHVLVGAVTLAVTAGLSIWGPGPLRLMCSLIGLAVGIAGGLLTGLIGMHDIARLGDVAWLAVPDPRWLSWGFEPVLIPTFVAAALAAAIRTVGVVTTAERMNDASWKRADPDNLRKGVVADGLGSVAGGILGGIGMSAAASLVAMSGATGATSRAIAWATAAFLVLFAFIPKIAALIIGLPIEIVGALLLFTAVFLMIAGLEIMVSRGIDTRTGFAISLSLLLGLLTIVKPAYFAALPEPLHTITSDMLTVTLFSVIVLILIFRIGIRRTDSLVWDGEAAPGDAFSRLLESDERKWKVAADTVARAEQAVSDLVGHLVQSGLVVEPARITAAFDQLDLVVEVVYRGTPPAPARRRFFRHHEESATSSGLASLLGADAADRSSVAVAGENVAIRLWFSV